MRWFVPAVIALFALYGMIRPFHYQGYTDFQVYYDAGARFWQQLIHPGSVSFEVAAGETSPFRYAPAFGWLFIPLHFFPFPWAKALWVLSQWALFALCLEQVARHYRLSQADRAILLVGTARFAHDNANIGQVALLLLAINLHAAIGARPSTRGVALGWATGLKAQPVAMAAIWVVHRRWRELLFLGLGIASVVGVSFAFGAGAVESWIELLSRSTRVLDPGIAGNQSLYGFWIRFVGSQAAPVPFAITSLIAAGLTLPLWWRSGRQESRAWELAFAYLPVLGVLTWKNTYVYWLLPLAAALASESRWRRLFACGLAFSWLLTSEGFVGGKLNGWLIEGGFLGWSAYLAAPLLLSGRTSPEARQLSPAEGSRSRSPREAS